MGRTTLGARLVAGVAGAAVLSAAFTTAAAPTAVATVQPGLGIATPAQPYKNNPEPTDWLGSYTVDGKQVWCVQYAYLAPDSDEPYRGGEPLKTKWGTELDGTVAADISYLLLRYSDTKSVDEAAALAHLLHSWTAAPQTPDQLLPTNDFRHVAYDVPFHQNALAQKSAGAVAAVDRLKADATANHGPWTAALTKPTKPQVIGTADTWTVEVRNAKTGVGKVPVKITLTDATVDGKTTATLNTKDDGSGIALQVTPTGPKPAVAISLLSPADRPVVRPAADENTQRVVSTGGEKELTAREDTTATTAPGNAAVTKVDEKTGKGIAKVSLRVTAADKTAPAVGQDGKPLLGADGKALVVVTGDDGKAVVPNLRTPQEICVVEVAAPAGYEQSFDPNAPPSACGKVDPGGTLELKVANKPNVPTVPKTIPAGENPAVAAAALVDESGPSTGLLVSLGALLLLAAGAGATLVRRARGPQVVGRKMRKDWGH
ncbi:hypothetical protein [Actinokineospora sp. NBRC 105648]|uniref:MSCRAMM family protein n=1 Tax=Actinokineospora sp. NBRC 105648 TaxID=3032206 RepID=UPI00249FA45B|nr:hypothetical protein [Actinokineospora sp. NBRC 105648]GLZ39871.1 hypothetical protein Acsp05_34950 [Actinokineospora sp. NBRC 105648]